MFAFKTRIGSSDSVVQAKTPSAAYAIRASTNFFLIVTKIPCFKVSRFQGFKDPKARDATLNPCNLETLLLFATLVHRGGFDPPYLLRGTDLQSVGFNHSPTCANPKTPFDRVNTAPTLQSISQPGKRSARTPA